MICECFIFVLKVHVSTKTQCLPLPENKYKSVISGNYYLFRHFYFELDHAQTRDLISLFVPAPVHPAPNKRSPSVPPAPVHAISNNQFGVSSHSLDPVPYKLVDQNADNASASRTSKNNFDEEASDWDDLDDGLTEKGLDAVSDYRPHINAVHDEQHDTMAILQKLQELSLLRQEKAQSSKDVVSISDKSIPQESPPGATFPKDPSNVTLEGDPVVKDNTSFEQHCGNDELVQIINEIAKKTEAIGKKQIESDQEILVLRKYVKNMKTKLQQLQYQHDKLQMEYSAVLLGETRNIVEGPSIFLIGGHNGISWLPSLDSFYPTIDRLMPLRPMSSARSYTGVAALNDHIYVFGGGDGSSWYNTVECYNRVSNEWMACPRLKQKKGSLAGATLNAIYSCRSRIKWGSLCSWWL